MYKTFSYKFTRNIINIINKWKHCTKNRTQLCDNSQNYLDIALFYFENFKLLNQFNDEGARFTDL